MKSLLYTIAALLMSNIVIAQDASDILSRSATKYAELKTYMDSGKVISHFYNNAHPRSNALIFKTAFSDNGAFNFEYYELGSTDINVLNRDAAKNVKVWKGFANTVVSGQPFNLAMAGFVGISNFTAALVPTLLMPEEQLVPRNIFNRLTDPKFVATEKVNGEECYRIDAKHPNESWTLWVSTSDLLIRKAESDRPVKDFRVRTTYNYYPYTTNDGAVFAFRPNRKVEL